MWDYNEIILTVYKSGYRRLVEMARAKSPAALEFVTCPEDGSVYYRKKSIQYMDVTCSSDIVSLYYLQASCWDNSCDGVAVIEEFMKTDTPYCFIRLGKEEDFDIEVRSQFDDAGELVHTVWMEREVGFWGHKILDGEAILRDEETHREEE